MYFKLTINALSIISIYQSIMRPKVLADFLKFSLKNNFPVLITGAPGVGKTDIVTSVTKGMSHKLLVMHPVVSDSVDFKGLPACVNGKAEFLEYGELRQMMEAVEPTVVFIDDFGQAEIQVQKAVMQLLLARTINGKKISDHVKFIAATNRQQDKAGVSTILEPVKSRFNAIVELEIHLDDWVEWAITHKMPIDLISFIRFKPDVITKFNPTREIKNSSCPRTVAGVGKMLNDGLPREMEQEVFAGAAGEAFSVEFCNFLKVCRDLPKPEEILKNPEHSFVPKELSQQWALTGALAYAVRGETFDNLLTYLKRLPPEFDVKAIRDTIRLQSKEIVMHPSFIKWSKANKELLFN